MPLAIFVWPAVRAVLMFLARRIAWLIIDALILYFFTALRDKLLEYITSIKAYIDEVCDRILTEIKDLIAQILGFIDEKILFYIENFKTKTFGVFDNLISLFTELTDKIDEFVEQVSTLKDLSTNGLELINSNSEIANIKLENSSSYISTIEQILIDNNLDTKEIESLKTLVSDAQKEIVKTLQKTGEIPKEIESFYQDKIVEKRNYIIDKITPISENLEEKKLELEEKYEEYITQARITLEDELNEIPTKIQDDFCGKIEEKIDEVFEQFNVDVLTELLQKEVENIDEEELSEKMGTIDFENEAKGVSKTSTTSAKVKFYKLIHKDTPAVSSSSWRMQEVHRILVNYFSRAERIALIEHLIKKDYYKIKTDPDDVKKKRKYTKKK